MSPNQTEATARPSGSKIHPAGLLPSGTHTMLELYGCDPALLDDQPFVEQAVRDAVSAAHCELLQIAVHKFQPQGVTAVALLAESHLSIHTWPEHKYAAIDLFTCGQTCDPNQACDLLAEQFAASRKVRNTIKRGEQDADSG